jgi:pentapeptide repeat protein
MANQPERASEPQPASERRAITWSGVPSLITAFTAVGALIFTALSLNATRDQIAIAQQGQYTDRYSRAIEQLGQQGPDKLQIRLGGIYALERLAHDSPQDQPTIMEVLTTFVRTSTHPKALEPTGTSCPDTPPAPDIQAALSVIGRRVTVHDGDAIINLNDLCLTRVNLESVNLSKATLNGADLRKAILAGAHLEGTQLVQADLSGAQLWNANLSGSHLESAKLTDANLENSKLVGADLSRISINSNTNFNGADLTEAYLEYAPIPR